MQSRARLHSQVRARGRRFWVRSRLALANVCFGFLAWVLGPRVRLAARVKPRSPQLKLASDVALPRQRFIVIDTRRSVRECRMILRDAGHGARRLMFLPTHRALIGAPGGGGRASSGCSMLSVWELERGAVPE